MLQAVCEAGQNVLDDTLYPGWVTVNCRFIIWVAVMPNTVTDLGALGSVDLVQLLSFDSQRTLVLTVNNRHARRLLAELSTRLRDDRRVMPLPAIVPLAAWFRQAADELSFSVDVSTPAHYLDAFAARGLWRQVIEEVEGDDASGLLDKATAARLALDADTLVDEWQLVIDSALETPDYQRFAVWRDTYRQRLSELDAEDGNISIGRVCCAAANGALTIDFERLVLAGFNELSPRLQSLVAAFGARGVEVLTLSAQRSGAGQKQRVVVADTDAEWWSAARWARDRLQENPHGRFAIVGSRLEADVALVHRVLRQTLPPTEGYNIAVARPLSEWPAVRAALAWLAVLADFKGAGRVTPKVAGAALLAGACAGASVEVAGRAKLDAQWRKKAVSSLSLPAFTQALAISPRNFIRPGSTALKLFLMGVHAIACRPGRHVFVTIWVIWASRGQAPQGARHFRPLRRLIVCWVSWVNMPWCGDRFLLPRQRACWVGWLPRPCFSRSEILSPVWMFWVCSRLKAGAGMLYGC